LSTAQGLAEDACRFDVPLLLWPGVRRPGLQGRRPPQTPGPRRAQRANWLRYGVQPKNARAGLRPGCCKGKAHRPEHLGYAGQRVLTSRKWSGKTLADHRGDQKARLLATLGMDEPDPSRYTWHVVTPDDHDHLPYDKRLLYVVAERTRLKAAFDEARRRAEEAAEPPAEGSAA
jgi:hypothetical protein